MTWVPNEYLKLYQLKITLRYTKPPIWRRVVVNGADDLGFISEVIQIAMGWEGGHLHRTTINGKAYEDPEFISEPLFDDDESALSEQNTPLAAVAKEKTKFLYEYDFGDGWEHDVVVEKILPFDKNEPQPRCLDGALACPPEDVGGSIGYEAFLQAITDRKHPDHHDMLEWIGGSFDPEAFSVDEVNHVLSQAWPKKVRDLFKKSASAVRKPSSTKTPTARKTTKRKKDTTKKAASRKKTSK